MSVLCQRPVRGSRMSSFYPVEEIPSLSSLDSAFQLQEYISLLIRHDVHDVEGIVTLPGLPNGKEQKKENPDNLEEENADVTEKKAEDSGKMDTTVDEACWIYEQLRRLAQDLTHPLITMLQQECTRASCPEMKAGEWLYLCVAHGTDGSTMEPCCAIDYILHTLDSATALLNTPRAFPSRLQIPPASHRHFSSLARRLGRIFAHAYFHHRETFDQAEAESSLYTRFLALTSKFDLVPSEFLVIPQRVYQDDNGAIGRHSEFSRDMATTTHLKGKALNAVNIPTFEEDSDQDIWSRSLTTSDNHVRYDNSKGANPTGFGNGRESPRKIGRSRTDTMVLHEGFAFVEELAKASSSNHSEVNHRKSIMHASSSRDDMIGDTEEASKPIVESTPHALASSQDIIPLDDDFFSQPPDSEEAAAPSSVTWDELSLENVTESSPFPDTDETDQSPILRGSTLSPSIPEDLLTVLGTSDIAPMTYHDLPARQECTADGKFTSDPDQHADGVNISINIELPEESGVLFPTEETPNLSVVKDPVTSLGPELDEYSGSEEVTENGKARSD